MEARADARSRMNGGRAGGSTGQARLTPAPTSFLFVSSATHPCVCRSMAKRRACRASSSRRAVSSRCALRAAPPRLPDPSDSLGRGRGQGYALPALLSERHGPFRKQSRKVRPLAERGKDPTAVAEKEALRHEIYLHP